MRRSVLAAALAAATMLTAGATFADPVDDLRQAVAPIADVGGIDDPAGGGGAPPGGRAVFSPVVGYVHITTLASTVPVVSLSGDLANPLNWTCTVPATFNPALPYSVTCTPSQNVNLIFECSVLHADITTHDPQAVARTSMDCNGDTVPEAQSSAYGNLPPNNHGFQWAPSNTLVTQFVCTVDNGAGLGAVPRWTAGCGDPGAPHL